VEHAESLKTIKFEENRIQNTPSLFDTPACISEISTQVIKAT
jgi:hypothetical protein